MTLPDRNHLFWWLYMAVLAGAALYIAYSFVGILVLGLFGYYAARPIRTRFERVVDSRPLAAALTVVTVLIPVLLLVLYAGIRVSQQIGRLIEEGGISDLSSRLGGVGALSGRGSGSASILQDPPSLGQLPDLLSGSMLQQGLGVLSAVFGTIMLVALAVTLSYALLVYDGSISKGFAKLVDGRDTTVYSYALAVDSDLVSIFFGNFLFVLVMSVIATVTYGVTNLVAPAGMQIPMVFTLGVLTGITSLIPIVVGKVVYLPVVAYLAVLAAQQGGGRFVFVGGVLVVYFLLLDILPQTFIQPYVSGRRFNAMILLFAYILGPILFGWYGFFLLPIVFVLMIETIRIVLPELLHGEPIVPEPELAEDTGAEAEEIREEVPDDETASEGNGTDTA